MKKSTSHVTLDHKKGRCVIAIDKVTLNDEGEYKIEAKNSAGVAMTAAELLVESKPVVAKATALLLLEGPVAVDCRRAFSACVCGVGHCGPLAAPSA